jgi:hypothetical protein
VSGALGTAFPSGPLIDPSTGDIAQAWRQMFVALWRRTGGAGGADAGGLATGLAAETAARTQRDIVLTNTIAAETTARANADAAELAARVTADQALTMGTNNAIGPEIAAREAADAALQTQITSNAAALAGKVNRAGDNMGGALGMLNVGFHGTTPIGKPTVSGAWAGNTAGKALCVALASYGLINDSTSA